MFYRVIFSWTIKKKLIGIGNLKFNFVPCWMIIAVLYDARSIEHKNWRQGIFINAT